MEVSDKKLPWGRLINDNPTAFVKKLIKNGENVALIEEKLTQDFAVTPEKAELISKILNNQKNIISNDNLVNLYINVSSGSNHTPNFINFAINHFKKFNRNENDINFIAIFPSYFNTLLKEIRAVKKIIARKAYVVKTIYIGGNIALLNANELDILLEELAYSVSEFTVECGSLKFLTKNKLQILKNYAVSRISINPETFISKTLKQLKKDFNLQDIVNLYKNALEFDFKVNIDLTAGLPQENLRNFKKNIDLLLELSPDNVTINAINKISETTDSKEMVDMINYATNKLISNGYSPYFLYKNNFVSTDYRNFLNGIANDCSSYIQKDELQKTISNINQNIEQTNNIFDNEVNNLNHNIEIIGYCKNGLQSIFESDCVMENSTIIACGVNSTTSRVCDGHAQNQINTGLITEYISKVEKIIADKIKLFK